MIFPESLFSNTARDDVSTQWAPFFTGVVASSAALAIIDTPPLDIPPGRILAVTGLTVIASPLAGTFPVSVQWHVFDAAGNIIFSELYGEAFQRLVGVVAEHIFPVEAYLISGSHRLGARASFSGAGATQFVNLFVRGVLMVRGNAALA